MSTQFRARRVASPAPKAYRFVEGDRVVIEALCPDVAMKHFAFGTFRRDEADDVKVVHCPICEGKHALMWPAAWVSGAAHTPDH